MSAPSFRRASPSPRPSSVQLWLLRHPIVFFALFAVASTSSDICGANFGNQMHTIGPVGGDLWAITKDNWTVYKLMPCDVVNDSLSRCMEVGSPVSLDSKWPELAKAVKEAANSTNYNFAINNSGIGYSPSFEDTVLAMHGASFNETGFFGFRFVANKSVYTKGIYEHEGCWISSDQKGKVYRILRSGKRDQIILRQINDPDAPDQLQIDSKLGSEENICNVSTENDVQVQFSKVSCTTGEMTFNVSRGVLYRDQFYLFASDKVYTFLDKSDKTKLVELSYETFFPCKKPTTTMAPLPSVNQTSNSPNETVSTHSSANKTTTQAPGSKFGLIVGLIILAIVIIVALICTYFYVTDRQYRAKEKAIAAKTAKPKKGPVSGISSAISSNVDSKVDSKVGSKVGSKVNSKVDSKVASKAGSKVSSYSKQTSAAQPKKGPSSKQN